MHKDFAAWYRAANIEPDGNALPKRWAAIESFEVSQSELADAARLFYGFEPQRKDFVETFRASLQAADPAVKMNGNNQELAVLAGAILINSIESIEPPYCYFAALVTVCPAAKNLRKAPVVPAIPELATEALLHWSTERFNHSSGAKENENRNTPAGLEKLRKLCKTAELTIAQLEAPLSQTYLAIQNIQEQLDDAHRQLSLQSEETNMLWWLLGEHSRDTKKAFGTYSPSVACLIAGKELADLTRELPGPVAATAFLEKLINSNRKAIPATVSIESAVNEAPPEWKEKFLNREGIDALRNLAPVMGALNAASKVPPGESWGSIYKHAEGIGADGKIKPSDLADQVYLEGLLLKTWILLATYE